jgi:hypothetical protein
MNPRVATFYAIGEKIWYQQVAQTNIRIAGIVEDVTVGLPMVSYGICLENNDRVWADLSQLLPRYR